MKTTIGAYNAATRSVLVTFTHGGIVHRRSVNAVLTANGGYDKAATKARVEEVASGVEAKIACGAIVASTPSPE